MRRALGVLLLAACGGHEAPPVAPEVPPEVPDAFRIWTESYGESGSELARVPGTRRDWALSEEGAHARPIEPERVVELHRLCLAAADVPQGGDGCETRERGFHADCGGGHTLGCGSDAGARLSEAFAILRRELAPR